MAVYELQVQTSYGMARVRFAANNDGETSALFHAVERVRSFTALLDEATPEGVESVTVLGPQQLSEATVRRIGHYDGLYQRLNPLLAADTDYQDAYLRNRVAIVGVEGLDEDEKAMLEVEY